MSLLNTNTGVGQAPAQETPIVQGTPVKESSVDAKAKKLEAAKRFKERKEQRAKEQYQNSLKLRDTLIKEGYLDKLPKEMKDFILSLCRDPAEKAVSTGFGGPSVFVTLFGESAKVGDSLTLEQVFNKTYKGKSTMDVWLKRWEEKGIVVSFEANPEKFLESKYIIKALPSA